MRAILPRFLSLIFLANTCAGAADFAWWNPDWQHRVKIAVTSVQSEDDFPADVRLNFSNYFGAGERFDPHSVRLVEQDPKTGQVVRECPAVFLPTDFRRRSYVPASRLAVWLPKPPQQVRATSESADHPAKNVIDDTTHFGGTTWRGAEQDPPWILSVDLGSPQWVNCVMARFPGAGDATGQPLDADFEVSCDSQDGLLKGTWERVGGWTNAANGRLYNIARVAWFTPRRVRYARLVVTRTVKGPPEFEDVQVWVARYHPETCAEGTVNWVVPGSVSPESERVFFVYFNKEGVTLESSLVEMTRFGLHREAEDAAVYAAPTGWSYATTNLEDASGAKTPNALTVDVHPQKYLYWDNAGMPVTIPESGAYTLTLRTRCDPGEHEFEVLVDNASIRKGKLQFGDGWTMAQIADLPIKAGVHYLEVFLTNGKERPLDLDCLWLTNYPEFRPKAFLKYKVNPGEVRP